MAPDPHFVRKLPGDRPALGVVSGAAFLILAGGTHWFLGDFSPGFGPITLLPAILLGGLFGGIGIGAIFAILSTFIAWMYFFPPYGTFTLTTPNRISMAVFALTAALELYVIWRLNLTIHALARSEERSNTLFRELQHRVANNFQFVSALLWARRKTIPADSAAAVAIDAARARLVMMSQVHRRLNDPRSIDAPLDKYLTDLCRALIDASDVPFVRLKIRSKPVRLDLEKLMTLSLIVAELVTNSLKHAFVGRDDGAITIDFETAHGVNILKIADDGPGLPEDFRKAAAGRLGQGILRSLARQLDGKVSFQSGTAKGTVATLIFR
jgi:two-component sensor histidine kinase